MNPSAPHRSVRALRLFGPRDLRLVDDPPLAPGRGEALVRVTSVGLCGSDLHWYEDAGIGETSLARPLVLGHEFAGVIDSGPRKGERVVADPADPCRRCDVCVSGRENLCPTTRFAGLSPTDGALREVMAWPAALLHRLPDAISDAEATLLEVLGIALHALDLGEVRAGMRVGVHGCGPVGLMVVAALAARRDIEVLATDPLEHRVRAARALGATAVLPPASDLPDGQEDGSSGSPVDVAFECAGEDAAVDAAIRTVAPGGRVVLVGIPAPDRTSFAASVARRKGLSFVFCRRMRPADLPAAVRLAAEGRVALASLVTHRFGLAEAAAAFEVLRARTGLKVVVEPSAARR